MNKLKMKKYVDTFDNPKREERFNMRLSKKERALLKVLSMADNRSMGDYLLDLMLRDASTKTELLEKLLPLQ